MKAFILGMLTLVYSTGSFAWSTFYCENYDGFLEGSLSAEGRLTLRTADAIVFAKNLKCTYLAPDKLIMKCSSNDSRTHFYSIYELISGFPEYYETNPKEVLTIKFKFTSTYYNENGDGVQYTKNFDFTPDMCLVQ